MLDKEARSICRTAAALFLVLAILASSLASVNSGTEGPYIVLTKKFYNPGELVRIEVINGSQGIDNGSGVAPIPLYISGPDGLSITLDAIWNGSGYDATYIPYSTGNYTIALSRNMTGVTESFTVDTIWITNEANVTPDGDGYSIQVTGQAWNALGYKKIYDLNCTLDGIEVYNGSSPDGNFNFTFSSPLSQGAAILGIQAIDGDGITGSTMAIVSAMDGPADGFGTLNVTAQPWPANNAWVPYIYMNWSPIRAPTYDVTPRGIDISSGGNVSSPIGRNNSVFYYYDYTSGTVYIRQLLSATPNATIPTPTVPWIRDIWGVEFDTNGDNFADWGVFLNGDPTPSIIAIGYNFNNVQDNRIRNILYTQDANPALGFSRSLSNGLGIDGNQMYYLDFQFPIAGLRVGGANPPGNISNTTPLRMFFGTGTGTPTYTFNRDILGRTSQVFFPYDRLTLDNNNFGAIYDTRDPNPPSNNGTWYYGENVTASGWGWPVSNASVQNITVRVINSTGAIMNTTIIPYNTATGNFTNVSIWPIALNSTALPGIYTIQVGDPWSNATVFDTYDYFTLADNRPPVVQNITITPNPAPPGGVNIFITANVTSNSPLSVVNATVNGTTVNMTFNVTSGLYQVNMTAPVLNGSYPVTVSATNIYGSVGNNSTGFAVVTFIHLAKTTTWNQATGNYTVILNATNPGTTRVVSIHDFIPVGFYTVWDNRTYIGPVTINMSFVLNGSSSRISTYPVNGTALAYYSTELYNEGMDPMAEAVTA
jgi:hypothetical protein